MKMGGVFEVCLKPDIVICGEIDRNDWLKPDHGGPWIPCQGI